MANITKTNGPQPSTEIEPFRTMRDMMRWDPFRAWDPFRTMMPTFSTLETAWNPSFEVRENGDAFLFKADLPGIKSDDVDVSLSGNRLNITGKREAEKETKDETVYVYERSYGSFARSFTLPEGIDADHIKSELKDGVLTIAVPKKAAAKPQKIAISTEGKKS
jgi:HSP20 family protein